MGGHCISEASTTSTTTRGVQHPVAAYADRVAGNLHSMTQLGTLSPELRTICRRLAQRWDMICRDAHERAAAGERTIDARPLH